MPKSAKEDDDKNISRSEKLLQLDLLGSSAILAALVCLLLALQWGGVTKAWSSSPVIGTLVGFGLILIAFGGIEYWLGEKALLIPQILGRRVVAVGSAFVFFVGGAFFVLLYCLPLYFQAVQGVSAIQSGIRNLALIISSTLFIVLVGGIITKTGYFAPLMVMGSSIATIGAGMIYTFSVDSKSAVWIGYQALVGFGIGLCFQTPIMAASAMAAREDVSSTSAIMLFFSTTGGAIFVSAATSAFDNQLVKSLAIHAPDLNPAKVIATGATALRATFSAEQLTGILAAYMDALRVQFILVIALAGCATLISLAAPWTSIRNAEEEKDDKADVTLVIG